MSHRKQASARRKAGWRLLREATQPEPIFAAAGMKQENRKVAPCPAMGKEPFFILFIP